jgi:uncharacterized protein
VADHDEGVAADGTIRTGAHRDRVPAAFEPVLTDAIAMAGAPGASLYVYGSVATGTARLRSSDVDLLSIDLPDAVYGYRVFLRHYCVHLSGPDPSTALPAFPADARAARGFNGDLGQHLSLWRQELESGTVAADLLGVRAARKTLLAVAGLVSVRDHTWTTDRSRAVRRWSELERDLAAQLGRLRSWAERHRRPSREGVERALAGDGIVPAIVARFSSLIGLWPDRPQGP